MVDPLRIALVVQRYGVEVSGGAETLARQIANLLSSDVELTVLTTCALDYTTWENHYPPGPTVVDGVDVLRFAVDAPRVPEAFEDASRLAYERPDDVELGRAWMHAQGPNASGLLEHLREHGASYDAVAFVTYLYATTADGLPLVADRSVLVPAVHDEPPLRLRLFDDVFACRPLAPLQHARRAGARAGPIRGRGRAGSHRRARGGRTAATPGAPTLELDRPYALYVGRLDLSKGVGDLIDAHRAYRERHPDGLDLVLVGSETLDAEEPWLRTLGFVPEAVKHEAIAGATIVVLPSPYESLSIVQLEAWSHGRPTLANARSAVLVGQTRRAGGGLWYDGPQEYTTMLDFLARSEPVAVTLGRQGRRFVNASFTWEEVRSRWLNALSEVAASDLPSGAV